MWKSESVYRGIRSHGRRFDKVSAFVRKVACSDFVLDACAKFLEVVMINAKNSHSKIRSVCRGFTGGNSHHIEGTGH